MWIIPIIAINFLLFFTKKIVIMVILVANIRKKKVKRNTVTNLPEDSWRVKVMKNAKIKHVRCVNGRKNSMRTGGLNGWRTTEHWNSTPTGWRTGRGTGEELWHHKFSVKFSFLRILQKVVKMEVTGEFFEALIYATFMRDTKSNFKVFTTDIFFFCLKSTG